jgi:hypothetical protein
MPPVRPLCFRRLGAGCLQWQALLLIAVLGCGSTLQQAFAFDARAHQEITFLAAKQLSRCLGSSGEPLFSPLEVRAIATSNAELADGNFFVRLFRWNYYDPLERQDNAVAWVLDTRFTGHFRSLERDIERAKSPEQSLEALGRLVNYVQMVTSPARALPVYAPRFWRWSFSDRFDRYPLRDAELEARLGEDCSHLESVPESYQALLAEVAADTVRALQGPIGRLPATWESFWAPPEAPGEFGSYGPAGNNFGRYTEFPCGPTDINRCVLITDDPAYMAFALERQLAAVRATARAMLLFRQGPGVAAVKDVTTPTEVTDEVTGEELSDAE